MLYLISLILFINSFPENQFISFKEDKCKCLLYPSIADQDIINYSQDTEFAVGDDDINNIMEPEVYYFKNKLKKPITELSDYNLTTAFNFGVGDYIEYTYDLRNLEDTKIDIRKILFFNGNRKSLLEWKKNGRIKKRMMS